MDSDVLTNKLINYEDLLVVRDIPRDRSVVLTMISFFEKIIRHKFKNNNDVIYGFCMKASEMLNVVPDYEFKGYNMEDPVIFAKVMFLGSRLLENIVNMFCIVTNATSFVASYECGFYLKIHEIMQIVLKNLSLHKTRLKLLKRVNNSRQVVTSIPDTIMGFILTTKGSQFLNIYKQKMSLIVEKLNTDNFYYSDKFVDEKKCLLIMNHVKVSIFEYIKDDIISLNSDNVYLIDRVFYPYKSTYDITDDDNITLTSKNSLLGNFIDNFESLIKGIQNIIVVFVLGKNNQQSNPSKKSKNGKFEEMINTVREKLLELGFRRDQIEHALNEVSNPMIFEEVFEWLIQNPEPQGSSNFDLEPTSIDAIPKLVEVPELEQTNPGRKEIKELEGIQYAKLIMDIFKKIAQYYFKNVLQISRVYSCIQSSMTVYTSQIGSDSRAAKKFLFDTYY